MLFIFENVAGKPAILLKYEPFTDVLQRLNLDNQKTFFPGQLIITASIYRAGE